MSKIETPAWQAVIHTFWWQGIGLCIVIGLIGACIYCLWDLKREEREAEAAAINESKMKFVTETIHLKEATFIYPEKPANSYEQGIPKTKILEGGYTNVN